MLSYDTISPQEEEEERISVIGLEGTGGNGK